MKSNKRLVTAVAFVALSALNAAFPSVAQAHCDTLSGPVVSAAREALDTSNVNLVLIWVQPTDEAAIRTAFVEALAERHKATAVKELAEVRFFETVVRIHRAGEGAPFTGIKPANTDIGPAVPAADEALKSGVVEPVQQLLSSAVQQGVQKHFQEARERHTYNPDDVAAGRAFVSAYVEYTHFVEGVYEAANAAGHHEHGSDDTRHSHNGTHDEHSGHVPWALAGLFGLAALGEGGWMLSRRKKSES